ncbi:MAG: lamin tail domain-containing protein [candidate division WOR-3 bacterium]
MRIVLNLTLATAMVALSGCTCTAAPAGYGLSKYHGVLFINEFMASNRSTIADERGDFDDWVELYNAGDKNIDVGGMFLTDDLSRATKWGFPDTFIPAGGYLIIWCDGENNEGPLHTTFKLNAGPGEAIGLFSSARDRVTLVDTLSFGPQRTDTSYGRLPDGGENWYFLSLPTPGHMNLSEASSFRGRLFLNEFMAANDSTIADEAGDYDDWIELFNADSLPVRLGGFYLTDNLRDRKKWVIPDTSIAAGGFLLIWADNEPTEGQLHTTFNLAAAGGEQLGLYEAKDTYALIIDTLTFGHQGVDTSFGRYPDGAPNWQFMTSPTPRHPNRLKK